MNLHVTRGLAAAAVATLAVASLPALVGPASAAPGTLSLVATSADGAAFDLDEHTLGDVTVQVTDSVAGAVDVDDAQDLLFHWTITPFDTSLPAVSVPATGDDTQATDTAGEFVVPLPTGQPSGRYALVAGLGPDAAAAGAVPVRTLLTVRAGQASVVLADGDALQVPAGTDHPLAGSVELEDGTGLPGRSVDLTLTRGTAGSDPQADAGLVPDPAGPPVTALQVTTGADGGFAAVLSDPVEDGQGTELGGSLAVASAGGSSATLAVDMVSEAPPAGSTLVVSDLGAGRPGESLAGDAVVTAPDDSFDVDPATPGVQGDAGTAPDPVEGQVVTLAVDHGFLTTGDDVLPSEVGAPAHRLVDLGRTLTAVTDAAGRVDLAVAIERDPGFDDDGLLTATVTATAGDVTGQSEADWDTADPFHGQVSVRLSPAREQEAPVAPAVSGDRTYYDVFTLDQFGNPVAGQPVDLTYAGNLDDWDYSDDFVVSDLDDAGDLWVVSFEPSDIEVTGTWNAPSFRYTDTAGGGVAGTEDATGSATASFYDVDFRRSSFALTSTARDTVKVGSTVTETVTVRDQLGRPVRGHRVQFFRFGPDATDGEPKASRVTNARGQATYTFVGTTLGRARITAEVTDGVRTRTLSGTVVFGAPVTARLSATPSGRRADLLTVTAQKRAAGARVVLYRVADGVRQRVGGRTHKLDATGRLDLRVKDRNGRRPTTYVAEVLSTPTTVADLTNSRRVR